MNVTYINHNGDIINLSKWPVVLSNPEELLESAWSYTTTGTGVVDDFFKEGKEKEVVIEIFADKEEEYRHILNNITQVTETDVVQRVPGKIMVNDYYLRCYIVGWKYEDYEEDFYATSKKVKVLAEKWSWVKEISYYIKPYMEGIETTQGGDFGYDYPHDYARKIPTRRIINEGIEAVDFELTIYGVCENPTITIGNNVYRVNAAIEQNEYMRINTLTKKVYKVKNNGEQVNLFYLRDRDNYVFEKIPPGKNEISWDGTFGFDITIFDERSEPKWI